MRLKVYPATAPLRGHYRPPGDKSVSHRAVMFAALAAGESRVRGFLDSADTRATCAAMRALGTRIDDDGAGGLVIRGATLIPPAGALDLGNSGTGLRLLAGLLAGHPALAGGAVTLSGDASLSRRPMKRIIEPLLRMGARIDSSGGCAPLTIHPSTLTGMTYVLPVASAQVKSAVLLAGLNARGTTRLVETAPSRDHTERLLPLFGVAVRRDGEALEVDGGQRLTPAEVRVPGDLSAAAFMLVAATLVPGSRVELAGVGVNPTRDGVLRILDAMGALVGRSGDTAHGGEPSATLTVRSAAMNGLEIAPEWVPLAIDEFPVILAAAARANGRTLIRGAAELRVKESDRLAEMCANLARLGVDVEETADGAVVTGGPVRGGRVDAAGDHRIAMSLAVLALVAEAPVEIENAEWIGTSYPNFVQDLTTLGGRLEWI